jgi:hypothetical protein
VFLTLADAESRGFAEVREKEGPDSSGAEVNRLVVRNRGEDPILICAGTVLKGGKQYRQVARDHVVAPRSVQALEAFCVEQGRWTSVREGRATAGLFSSTDTVANKRIRASAQYLADQSEVWANVSRVNGFAKKAPSTDTFLATLEDASASQRRGEIEDAVRRHFDALHRAKTEPVGFAYAINGEPLTMRTFAGPDLFRRHFPAFRRAMCMEADVIQRRDQASGRTVDNRAASSEIMLEMLRAIEAGKPLPVSEWTTSRILRRTSTRGEKSALWVRRGLDPKAPWVEVTADWTAPLEYEAPVREYLEQLKALGYTQ